MRKVFVRSEPADGLDSFFRGGHAWPRSGRLVNVSEDLYKLLKKSARISVDNEPDVEMQVEAEPLELISHRKDGANPAIEAETENAKLNKEIARLDREAENAKLRAELEAKQKAMKAPEPEVVVEDKKSKGK